MIGLVRAIVAFVIGFTLMLGVLGTKRALGAETRFELEWRRLMIRPPDSGIASHFEDTIASTGERLYPYNSDPEKFVCAHADEPMGTVLKVCSVVTGKCVRCRIGDRGPNPKLKRAIDLPPSGFTALGLRLVDGLGYVVIDRD